VSADACCVERSRFENNVSKGSLQTSVYTIRSFGGILGALMGALLYNNATWGWGLSIANIFFLAGVIPLSGVLLAVWPLEEVCVSKITPSFSEQMQSIWSTLQLKAVLMPITFIYIYYVFQIPNAAWTNFLVLGWYNLNGSQSHVVISYLQHWISQTLRLAC
jgi:hypothetical protein